MRTFNNPFIGHNEGPFPGNSLSKLFRALMNLRSATVLTFGIFVLIVSSVVSSLSQECTSYDIVTVRGTGNSNIVYGTSLLNLIGFIAVDGGRTEFEYSYDVRPDPLYTSPG